MNYEFKELDVVVANHDINERVKKGVEGCIMIVYDESNFEVEFFVESFFGDVADVLTVCIGDIELKDKG